MTIYADSNGSYTVDEAIRIRKIIEEYRIDFFEEPVPFDWYEETKLVEDRLNRPCVMQISGSVITTKLLNSNS